MVLVRFGGTFGMALPAKGSLMRIFRSVIVLAGEGLENHLNIENGWCRTFRAQWLEA